MFRNREIIAAVEFGTSKFTLLVGEVASDGQLRIIGSAAAPSSGIVVKGEIRDMQKASVLFNKLLEDADKSCGGALNEVQLITVLVTGCGILSQTGVGSVFIRNEARVVTEAECSEAAENALIRSLAEDREVINSTESYWLVDNRRVANPLRLSGSKLEAHAHIVHGLHSRIENFRSVVIDAGFEDTKLDVTFSPLAAGTGILSDRERENGVLLVDIGAGCTEYMVSYDNGVAASGVLQVGFEHVVNDLAVGLDLTADFCRKLMEMGAISRAIQERREYIELKSRTTGKLLRIPTASFETIIDLRVREIFEIIRKQLQAEQVPRSLGAGGVLTGGGVLYCRTADLFREVFELSCRIGQPVDLDGAITDLSGPRCSAVWGALRVAAGYLEQYGPARQGMLDRAFDRLGRFFDHGCRNVKQIKDSMKM